MVQDGQTQLFGLLNLGILLTVWAIMIQVERRRKASYQISAQ